MNGVIMWVLVTSNSCYKSFYKPHLLINRSFERERERESSYNHSYELICKSESGLQNMAIRQVLLPRVGGSPFWESCKRKSRRDTP